MNKVIYNKKIKYYKKQKNNTKINKYLKKLGIKEIELMNEPLVGGDYEQINFNKRSQIFRVKNEPLKIYNLINEEELGSGTHGFVNMYDLVLDGIELMTVVTKEFENNESYLIEKDIYFRFKIKNIEGDINSKLLFYSDEYKILIFKYLGETLNNIPIQRFSMKRRLKMVENILNENFKLMMANFIHNDIKLSNISYDTKMNKVSMIDYGLSFDIHINQFEYLDSTYVSLSNFYLEIYNLIDKLEIHKKQGTMTHKIHEQSFKKYKDYAFKSQLYTLGILSACIIIGNFNYINIESFEEYFGDQKFEPLLERLSGFTSVNCKQYILDIENDMQEKLQKMNTNGISHENISNLIKFLCNLGYWNEFDYTSEYEKYNIGGNETLKQYNEPNDNLMMLSNLIRIIKSLIKH